MLLGGQHDIFRICLNLNTYDTCVPENLKQVTSTLPLKAIPKFSSFRPKLTFSAMIRPVIDLFYACYHNSDRVVQADRSALCTELSYGQSQTLGPSSSHCCCAVRNPDLGLEIVHQYLQNETELMIDPSILHNNQAIG